MRIVWDKVTRFSQIVAILLGLAIFFVAFQIGRRYEVRSILGAPTTDVVRFSCANGKSIEARFYSRFVHIETSGDGAAYLPQTISASGARYANSDESLVFWNKGDTAFITQGDPNTQTYADCTIR